MTRLGLVVHGQPPELVGGTEQLVATQAAALAAAGHEVQVFAGSIEWRAQDEVVRDGSGPVPVIRVHRSDLFFERWDKLENPRVERAYGEWLDDFRPQLVHVHHWARLTTTLVRVAAARGVPAVVSLHDLFASCPRYHRVKPDDSFCSETPGVEACLNCTPRWSFQADTEITSSLRVFVDDLRAEVAAAAAIVAPTAGHAQRIMSWLGLELGRPVHALPPVGSGVGQPATRPLGERVASAGEPLRVGVFGHLHPLKGVEVLLDAQARLADPAAVEVHVWGEAPDEAMAEAIHARAGSRAVVWHGAYAPEDLAAAPVDVVVLPTLCAESYSFTLDEAASLEVPVLATDLGALADRATPRVELFPRGDVDALARALERLGGDPGRRRSMRAAPAPARRDAEAHDRALLELYAAVLGREPPPVQPREAGALRRREHAFGLREAGLGELLRSEGWEAVVAGLQAERDALQARLGGQGGAPGA